MKALRLQNQWTRSNDGWLAGVCQGLGERFEINSGLLRLLWFASVFFFGVGLIFYFICAFCLPLQGQEEEALKPRVLGVCSRLSQRMDIDVGLLRVLTVLIALGSMGTTALVYIVAHFLIPTETSYQD